MSGRRLWRLVLVVALVLGLPMSAAAQDVVEYYGTDAIGSVRIVFDASGNIVGRMDYGPFGEQISASTVGHKSYAGLFRDGEGGLDYAQARSFQVRIGRFSAPDPVYAGLFEPQRWNRYAYALNNPLTFVDPTGLDCQTTMKEGGFEIKCPNGDGESNAGSSVASANDFFLRMELEWLLGGSRGGSQGGGGGSRLQLPPPPENCFLSSTAACQAFKDRIASNDGEVSLAASPQAAAAAVVLSTAIKVGEQLVRAAPAASRYARTAAQFPDKVAKWEWHHVVPKYLGGAKDGLQVLIRADYHQAITNAFRQAYAYGQGTAPTGARLANILNDVYRQFPLPPSPHRP